MDQSIETDPNEKQPDVSNCRVRRMGDGIEVCMMNTHCSYALPFGNICSHPSASQITDWAPHVK